MLGECLHSSSSLWECELELCDWVLLRVFLPLSVLVFSLPVHLLNITKRKVHLSSSHWTRLDLARLLVTVVILIINISSSRLESCPGLSLPLVLLSSLTSGLIIVLQLKMGASKTILLFWLVNSIIYLQRVMTELRRETGGQHD